MTNITEFRVPPKTVREHYHKHDITIKFDPRLHSWEWEVYITITTRLHGTGKTVEKCLTQAKEQIDVATGHSV